MSPRATPGMTTITVRVADALRSPAGTGADSRLRPHRDRTGNAKAQAVWSPPAAGTLAGAAEEPAVAPTGYEWLNAINWGVVLDRLTWSAITAFLGWYFLKP